MKYAMKGAMAVGLVALAFNLGGCNSSTANATAEKSPDPAEAAAAAMDREAAKAAAPAEQPPAK